MSVYPGHEDMRANPIRAWKDRAEAAERKVKRLREREDWLVKQLDGCIDDATILSEVRPLAIGRALVRNLKDARTVLAESEGVEAIA